MGDPPSRRRRVGLALLAASLALGSALAWIRVDLPPPLGARSLTEAPWPEAPWVRVYVAGIPGLASLATHPSLVVQPEPGAALETWEVWQSARPPHGHVFHDVHPPEANVGGGPTRLWAQYEGEEARRILAVLEGADAYPCRDRYRYWPGPNSNGFVRWVLDGAGIDDRLPRSSFGAGWGCR